jgi:hypothetical protein
MPRGQPRDPHKEQSLPSGHRRSCLIAYPPGMVSPVMAIWLLSQATACAEAAPCPELLRSYGCQTEMTVP